MNRDQLANIHTIMCEEAKQLLLKKNSDYSSDGDCFGNLRACEDFGLASMEVGILVRMLDKLRRVGNLLSRPTAVRDESIRDSLRDVINYTVLLQAAISSRGQAFVVTHVDPEATSVTLAECESPAAPSVAQDLRCPECQHYRLPTAETKCCLICYNHRCETCHTMIPEGEPRHKRDNGRVWCHQCYAEHGN